MGAGKRNYKEFDQEIQLKTGSFSTSINLLQDPLTGNDFDQVSFLFYSNVQLKKAVHCNCSY